MDIRNYVQVDSSGEIVQYPYAFLTEEQQKEIDAGITSASDITIPDDAVLVNRTKNIPTLGWNERSVEGDVLKETDDDGNPIYATQYTKVEIATTSNEKRTRVQSLKMSWNDQNEVRYATELAAIQSHLFITEDMGSFQLKRTEAEKYLADNSIDTPILSAMAAVTGDTLTDLAEDIIAKSNEYNTLYGTLSGKYQANRLMLIAVEPTDPTTYDLLNNYQTF